MTTCVVTEDSRIKATIKPWKGSEEVDMLIRKGTQARLEKGGNAGHCRVSIFYPRHVVVAQIPTGIIKF